MSSSPVPVVSAPDLPAPLGPVCANCGAPLSGEYCVACGQRHEPHVHSVRHFASEAFESITHADSRLWRTLGYLLVKPGRLTREFFAICRSSLSRYLLMGGIVPALPGSGYDGLMMLSSCCRKPSMRSVCS